MWLTGLGLELGMKLAGDEEGMPGQFDDFDQSAVRGETAEYVSCFLEALAIGIVEFVTMAMALAHDKGAVEPSRFGSHDQLAGLRSEPHRAAFPGHARLLVQHGDYRVWCSGVEFRRVSLGQV